MYAGLNDIAWATMTQAYGTAEGVPALLWGLISSDVDERELALDDFWASVHHQGDIYESTVAAIPFLLEAAGTPGLPGRGEILRLLAHIGGAEHTAGPPEPEIDARARRAVAEAQPLFLSLLGDPEPEVRGQAAHALLAGDPVGLAPVLRERLAAETDPEARAELLTVAGTAGERTGDAELGAWLAGLPGDAEFRLSAFIRAARCGHHVPPAETGERIQAAFDAEVDEAGSMVAELAEALAGRVDDRVALLTGMLRAPDPQPRAAVWAAETLMTTYRGPYADLVALIGDLLAEIDPQARSRALRVLACLDELAGPAADALAATLEPPRWVLLQPAVPALAALRDTRGLSALRQGLEQPSPLAEVGRHVGRYGPMALDFTPLILRRLRDLPVPEGHDETRCALLGALRMIRPEAATVVPELLRQPPTEDVMATLGSFGPAAAAAVPVLRERLEDGGPGEAITAATALWRITAERGPLLRAAERGRGPGAVRARWRATGDAEAALPALTTAWAATPECRAVIARTVTEMGRAAAGIEPLLRAELDRPLRSTAGRVGWSGTRIADDLELQHACLDALAAIGRPAPRAGGRPVR